MADEPGWRPRPTIDPYRVGSHGAGPRARRRRGSTGLNSIDLLEQQHNDVEEMFERFKNADDDARERIAREVIEHLRVHTTIEEEIFYPAVRERMDMDDEILEDLEEHHAVEMLLDELEGMTSSDERFAAKFEVISELVSHHVEEEREDLFPEVRDGLDDDLLEELGQRMEERTAELMGPGAEDATKEELYRRAQELGIEGRSQMSKRQLASAIRAADG